MVNLGLSGVYLWKRNSVYTYPWQRQFLNVDFLKYEKKRIQDVAKWYSKFQKVKVGQKLEEVYYYVTPTELSSEWKGAIASKGNYNFVGLSALKNCLQVQILMLFPKEKSAPRDYSLIRISGAKKDYIHNEKKGEAQYIIMSDEFQEQDPSLVYLDVPYEKKVISKFIKENLVNDDFIANSFQPTISGSPYVVNKKGGVSFSAFLKNTPFSEELFNVLKLMQPPEFSDVQFQLSPKLIEGKNILSSQGLKFRVAEKSIFESSAEKPWVSKNCILPGLSAVIFSSFASFPAIIISAILMTQSALGLTFWSIISAQISFLPSWEKCGCNTPFLSSIFVSCQNFLPFLSVNHKLLLTPIPGLVRAFSCSDNISDNPFNLGSTD